MPGYYLNVDMSSIVFHIDYTPIVFSSHWFIQKNGSYRGVDVIANIKCCKEQFGYFGDGRLGYFLLLHFYLYIAQGILCINEKKPGGSPNSPYTTKDEVDSSKIMGQIGSTYAVDAVLGLGDNFYDSGVKNEYDPRFKETFEDVFTAPSIANIPYWMVAGNHDHRGNVSGEIHYSNHSQRWNFPDFYYNTIFKIPGSTEKTLELVMIDTVDLCGISDDKEYCDNHGISMEQCLIHPTGLYLIHTSMEYSIISDNF